MSRTNNVIDLTQESDEESRDRYRVNHQTHVKPIASTFRPRLPLQQTRDGGSVANPGGNPAYFSQSLRHQHQPQHRPHQSQYQQHHNLLQIQRQVPQVNLGHVRKQGTFAASLLGQNQAYAHYRESAKASTTPFSSSAIVSAQRVQKRACINCQEDNTTCDGERPCSACVEPGLHCFYPGEKPHAPLNKSTQSSINVRPQTSTTTLRPNSSTAPLDTLSYTSKLTSTSRPTTVKVPLGKTNLIVSDNIRGTEPVNLERFHDSDESDDDDVPLAIAELEEVKRLLTRHEERMKDHHAYLLQPLLNQAKHDALKAPTSNPSRTPRGHPFAKLTTSHKYSAVSGSNKTPSVCVQMKSHKLGAPKKWIQISVNLRTLQTDSTILPKYKSIGRLGTSLLAPNIRTLKYWPYFPDEENLDPSEAKKNEELEERYQHDDNRLLAQRKCSELVDLWRPWISDFVSKLRIEFGDILYWFLNSSEMTTCETCDRSIFAKSFSDISRVLPKPNERSLTLARLSTAALNEVAHISMWHFVLDAPSVKDLLLQIESPKKSVVTLCSVCFLHNCLSHGAYQEPDELGGTGVAVIMGGNIEINDEEADHNIRLAAAVPNHSHEADHQCSLYCVAAEVRVKDILGRKKDGTLGGIHRRDVHVPRLTIRNDEMCGEKCYWPVEKRTKFSTVAQTKDFQPKLTPQSTKLLKQLLRIYSDNQRAPCMLAKEVDGLDCVDAFYYLLGETQRISHFRQAVASAVQQGTRKISKIAAGLDTTLSADLDERPPFVPCSHTGSCLNNPDCTCAQNKVHCEWFCGCDKTCERRFPGCKCAVSNKMCFNDRNCECWKHNRECDPWLCGTCGVVEILDPQNKYNDAIRTGRCKNSCIQLDLPARTIKAPSEVQGWGLYAGTDLDENAFVGEYKGETVGNQESDRRGAVYANIGQEYLFVMNRDQQIDGSNFGNKTRFINNSQREDYINIFAKKLLCNGVQRVMLYAKKPIKAGEELLYNYNYPVSVTKKFWERGEGPTNAAGAVVAKPSIMWAQPRVNGRFARVAGKQDGEQSPTVRVDVPSRDGSSAEEDGSAASKRDTKRKRVSEAGPMNRPTGTTIQKSPKGDVGKPLQFPDDPDDSDYELLEATESSESVDGADSGSGPGEQPASTHRSSVVRPNDRRRGGLAQSKAWETRRKRTEKPK